MRVALLCIKVQQTQESFLDPAPSGSHDSGKVPLQPVTSDIKSQSTKWGLHTFKIAHSYTVNGARSHAMCNHAPLHEPVCWLQAVPGNVCTALQATLDRRQASTWLFSSAFVMPLAGHFVWHMGHDIHSPSAMPCSPALLRLGTLSTPGRSAVLTSVTSITSSSELASDLTAVLT